jgi:3-hydroxybutyryl-CoA dehydrogenase
LSDVVLHGDGDLARALAHVLAQAGVAHMRQCNSDWEGLDSAQGQLRLTDGRPAAQVAAQTRVAQVALVDLALAEPSGASLAWTAAASARTDWRETVASLLALAGWRPAVVADSAGLVVARTLAMLINEAADAVLQGVCDEDGADTAMRLGANYPVGPHDWLRQWGAPSVVHLLDHLDAHYRGERYRVSPALRQRLWQMETRA